MRLIRAQFILVTLAVAAAIALAACSTIDPPNNDLLTSSIAPSTVRKSICVIAAIGDTFSVQKIGVTVFGNALDKHPIDAWGIDSAVASKISTRLSPRFDVRRIDYPVGTFLPVEQVKSVLSSDYKDHRAEIRDIARNITASQRCDLCIVVTKSSSMYSNTNQAMSGLGILDNSNLLFENVFLFAIWEMRVFDGKTFEVLAHKRATSQDPPLMAAIRGPNRKVDKTWLPAPGQVAQSARLRNATAELVAQSLDPVVTELFTIR
jgi:hypothetical protein